MTKNEVEESDFCLGKVTISVKEVLDYLENHTPEEIIYPLINFLLIEKGIEFDPVTTLDIRGSATFIVFGSEEVEATVRVATYPNCPYPNCNKVCDERDHALCEKYQNNLLKIKESEEKDQEENDEFEDKYFTRGGYLI